MKIPVGVFLFLGLAVGCAGAKTVPEALDSNYVPTGEVVLRGRTASFDAVRVRSVACNLSKRTDGSWAGTMNEKPVDVDVTDLVISGAGGFRVTREDSEGQSLIYTGQFNGKIYRFEFDQTQAIIRGPVTSGTFGGKRVENGVTKYGPRGELELRGQAGADSPPWPQLALALIASLQTSF